VARGEARPDSDVDLLVEFDRPIGLFGLIALQLRLEELLGCPVDIGSWDSLKAPVRSNVMKECVYVS
jgi:predicted nucleotidyltransferase